MQTTVTIMKAYVDGYVNWFSPANVNFRAMPKALTDMTETEPTVEQIDM